MTVVQKSMQMDCRMCSQNFKLKKEVLQMVLFEQVLEKHAGETVKDSELLKKLLEEARKFKDGEWHTEGVNGEPQYNVEHGNISIRLCVKWPDVRQILEGIDIKELVWMIELQDENRKAMVTKS